MFLEETGFDGLKLIHYFSVEDKRGAFEKIFNRKKLNVDFSISEVFYSISRKKVLRGMHFQKPPYTQDKILFVIQGKIEDVVLDLRANSNTYKKFYSRIISSREKTALYIPKGFAHGFLSLSDNTITGYLTSSIYSEKHDSGIKWNSFGYSWSVQKPIISKKDSNLVTLNKFNTPFG